MSFGSTNRTPPPPKKLGNLDANRINTNQQAIPVTYMAGRRRVALHWHTPAYNQVNEKVTADAGKGADDRVTGIIYYVDHAGLICLGGRKPLDRFYRHWSDNELDWENPAGLSRDADPFEPVTIENVGSIRIYWGTETQPIDTLILTPRATPDPLPVDFDTRDPQTWPDSDQTIHHPGYQPP